MTGFGINVLGFGSGGGSATVEIPSQTAINGQSNYENVVASNFVARGDTLVITSGFWVWSNNSSPALTVDVSDITIENNGKIIGRGGQNNGSVG